MSYPSYDAPMLKEALRKISELIDSVDTFDNDAFDLGATLREVREIANDALKKADG